MKVRVLGCGTSSGVPRIGGDWGDCDPAEPRNRRTRSALLIEADGDEGERGERLLVDCGPDLRAQLLAAGIGSVDRLIVTHDHADHCHGIDELRPIAQQLGHAVPLLGRPEVLRLLVNRFGYVFANSRFYSAIAEPVPIVGESLDTGALKLGFVDQPHGPIQSLGIRAEQNGRSCVYAIDFSAMTDAMASLYQGADLWVADCLRRNPHPTHASLDAVLGWARELGVGQLLLTHLDKSMDYATLVGELPDWAEPAYDGQEVELC